MSTKRLFLLAVLAAVTTLSVAAQGVNAHGSDVRLEARLVPTSADPRASGDAQFQSEQDRGSTIRRQFEVKVEDVSSADSVRVLVNGAQVWPVVKIGATVAMVSSSSIPTMGTWSQSSRPGTSSAS